MKHTLSESIRYFLKIRSLRLSCYLYYCKGFVAKTTLLHHYETLYVLLRYSRVINILRVVNWVVKGFDNCSRVNRYVCISKNQCRTLLLLFSLIAFAFDSSACFLTKFTKPLFLIHYSKNTAYLTLRWSTFYLVLLKSRTKTAEPPCGLTKNFWGDVAYKVEKVDEIYVVMRKLLHL